jgi:uncharacterized protein involved in exopolysaccharide biosynthesis
MVFALDTLSYAKRLRESGIPSHEAEAHAEAVREFIMTELATKSDLIAQIGSVRSETATEFRSVRAEIASFRTEVASEFGSVRAEIGSVRAEIGSVRAEMASEFVAVRAEIASVRSEVNVLRADFLAFKREIREDLSATKRDLLETIASSRRELMAAINAVELRVTVRMGAMFAVSIGILAAIIKF